MRLSADKDDIGYDPMANAAFAIKSIHLDGYDITHTAIVTADTLTGTVIKYRTWPDDSLVVWPGHDEVETIEAHGEVEIELNDGWVYKRGMLLRTMESCKLEMKYDEHRKA
jgi:hypothetical protein